MEIVCARYKFDESLIAVANLRSSSAIAENARINYIIINRPRLNNNRI